MLDALSKQELLHPGISFFLIAIIDIIGLYCIVGRRKSFRDPEEARDYFIMRYNRNVSVSIIAFALTTLAIYGFYDVDVTLHDPINLVGAVMLGFILGLITLYGLMFLPVRLFCPSCDKYIPSDEPWRCGFCHHQHAGIVHRSFLGSCGKCGELPNAYQCHHCGDLVFLNGEESTLNYARSTLVPPRPLKSESEIAAERQAKRVAEEERRLNLAKEAQWKKEEINRDIELDKLLLDRTEARTRLWVAETKHSNLTEPKVPKNARELLEEDEAKDRIRHLAVDDVIFKRTKEAELEFKDNPDMLERVKEHLVRWREKHLL